MSAGRDVAAVPPRSGERVTRMAEVVRLEPLAEDLFRAAGDGGGPERIFGGRVVAQALLAAGRTAPPGRQVHSLHASFLRPGDLALPVDHRVDRVRDGGSYSTRQVVAEQDGRAILLLTASFHVPEDGLGHQAPQLDAPELALLPGPEELGATAEGPVARWFARLPARHPFDLRFAEDLPRIAAGRGEAAPPRQRFWLRCREELPADPLVHACAAAYASDMLLLSTALAPHATMIGAPDVASASLDHAVWFHRPLRADDWLFYDQESSWAGGGRALCHGRVFDRAGRLVLTVAQEGMVRRRPVAP